MREIRTSGSVGAPQGDLGGDPATNFHSHSPTVNGPLGGPS
jgi:hypothetical protein